MLVTQRVSEAPVGGMRSKLIWVTDNCGKIECMSVQPLIEQQVSLLRDRVPLREDPEVGTAEDLSPRPAATPGGPWIP
jgi:hypothetical protein